MFDLVQVKWFGFIPKRPKQSHPQLVHWWVLVHSSHEKTLSCTYFMAGVLVPSASVKFLCDCTKCVICNGLRKMLKVLSQKYFKATTVHLSLCFLINIQNMVVAFWRNFKFQSSLLLGFRMQVICCVRLGVFLF